MTRSTNIFDKKTKTQIKLKPKADLPTIPTIPRLPIIPEVSLDAQELKRETLHKRRRLLELRKAAATTNNITSSGTG